MSIRVMIATWFDRLASELIEGAPVNPTLKLLKAKRSSP
jgi:hypothetical protein